jgi:plasmid maintenance system antidote protein VapI
MRRGRDKKSIIDHSTENISRCHQKKDAEKVGVPLEYVNRITKGREQIVNKTFVKMMDELGYDVELTYKRKTEEKIAR